MADAATSSPSDRAPGKSALHAQAAAAEQSGKGAGADSRPKASIARNASRLISVTTIFVVLQYGREILAAQEFGASFEFDMFLLAGVVPAMLHTWASGLIESNLVPVYVSLRASDPDEVPRFIASAFAYVAAISLAIGAILWVLAEPLLGLMQPREDLAAAAPQFVELFRILLVWAFAHMVFGCLRAVSHARGRFATPAILQLLLPIGAIIGLLVLAPTMGARGLALGLTAGGVAHLLIMIALHVRDVARWPGLRPHPALRRMARNVAAFGVGMLFVGTILVVDRAWAATLEEGRLSAIGYADRLFHLSARLLVIPICATLLPVWSRHATRDDAEPFRRAVETGLRILITLLLPIAVAMIVLAEPVVTLVYKRGAFDASAMSLTSAAVAAFGVALLVHGASAALQRACHAQQWMRLITVHGAIVLAAKIAFNAWLVPLHGHVGIILALPCALGVGAIFLFATIARRAGTPCSRHSAAHLGMAVIAAGVGLAGAWAALRAIGNSGCLAGVESWLAALIELAVGGLAIMICFVVITAATGNPDVRWLANRIRSRFRRSAQPAPPATPPNPDSTP